MSGVSKVNKKSNLEKLLEGLFSNDKKSNLSCLLEELYTSIDKEEKNLAGAHGELAGEEAGFEQDGENLKDKEPETPEEFVDDFKDSVINPVDPSEEVISDEQMEDYLEGRFEQGTNVKDTAPANESVYGMNEFNENVYEQEEKSAGARAVV